MSSKLIFFFLAFLAIVLAISSEATARDLAEKSTEEATLGDAKYYGYSPGYGGYGPRYGGYGGHGGRGGYPGRGGYGGYPGHGGYIGHDDARVEDKN
ncbi:hypothetical protein AKJ16_DCAP26555 [Drosera capensis]